MSLICKLGSHLPQTSRDQTTVLAFNSCTKCVGHPGGITRPHARLQPSFLDMETLMTSKLNVALICKLGVLLTCLAYILACFPWFFLQSSTDSRPVQELNVSTVTVIVWAHTQENSRANTSHSHRFPTVKNPTRTYQKIPRFKLFLGSQNFARFL